MYKQHQSKEGQRGMVKGRRVGVGNANVEQGVISKPVITRYRGSNLHINKADSEEENCRTQREHEKFQSTANIHLRCAWHLDMELQLSDKTGDVQDGVAVDELPLSERIKLLHFLHHIFLKCSTAYGEGWAECRKPGFLHNLSLEKCERQPGKTPLFCMLEAAYTGCQQKAIFYHHYTIQRPFICGLGEQEESALWQIFLVLKGNLWSKVSSRAAESFDSQ
ncbi:hypothetical protein JEQ12_002388 [Ovis aries]|uniref:Uncharacterized protein n=1 Tax=Ovis aries TaxID=9940 RepID=A0A836A485_SHEEP|nr:hypothetical protein JEQ12_002388 [Ovis aries]